MTHARLFPFENSYARLPERFFRSLPPTPVALPQLIRLNEALALDLGLNPAVLASPEAIEVFAGNRVPEGAEPLAMAYAGLQFGNWVPQLGDGRAILLGEVVGQDGVRRDIQLKGAGPTPFSRGGDGRAALGPVLREFVVSEAMAALDIPTTRSLAAVTTGEWVVRESPLPGAVLTRVAQSHIRIGTFQYFEAREDVEAIRLLADHVLARHYPDQAASDDPYLELLKAVLRRQAALVAQWQLVGFIHGVMNTDNASVAGETIDYGPCAFMDAYDPETVYSSIDARGRYAYCNQPAIAHWNIARFAQSLLPLLGEAREAAVARANQAIARFPDCFEEAYLSGARRKLGFDSAGEEDSELLSDLLKVMAENQADFTLTFRNLCEVSQSGAEGEEPLRRLFREPAALDPWLGRWRARLASEARLEGERREAMRRANPAFIPRNHLIEEVIEAAVAEGDLKPFQQLVDVLSAPWDTASGDGRYAAPPRPEQVVHQTFCGT